VSWTSQVSDNRELPPQLFRSLGPVTQALVVFFAVLIPTFLFSPDPRSSTAVLQSVILQLLLVALVPLAVAHSLNFDKILVFSLRPISRKNFLWCLLLGSSAIFLMDEIAFLQQRLTGVQANLSPEVEKLLHADSVLQLGWIVFAMALTPAICEELLFRGFILGRFLEAGGPGQSLMMTSLLFGLFHRNLATLLPMTLAGILLAFAVWRTGSLYCGITMHALINMWAIVVVNARLEESLPWTRQPSHLPAGLLLICILCVVVAGKQLHKEQLAGTGEQDS